MSRPEFAAKILRPLEPASILDIGCRDASLADEFPGTDYAGADLVQDDRGRVKYVGDVTKVDFDRTFDAVVALDILEHVDDPSALFDRIVKTADRFLVVSLPNTYDLKSRIKFALEGQLGGKYEFREQTPRDRHRWLMNRAEIEAFYRAKATKHGLSVQQFDMLYGVSGRATFEARVGRVLSRLLPPTLTARTIFALFSKHEMNLH